MPLPLLAVPLLIKGTAVLAGVVGVGAAVKGAKDMNDANNTLKAAQEKHEKNIKYFTTENQKTSKVMDELGEKELKILAGFEKFSDLIEQISNRPDFKTYTKSNVTIPNYDPEELKKVSVGAGVLLGGLGGAALGTAGGFAAAGGTTAAVMALGTASTGTAIASLTGVAATNATLAALGGGSIATGGAGVVGGTAVLGAATLGVGLMIGGVIFSLVGSKMSSKADEAISQAQKAEKEIYKICHYLKSLNETAQKYQKSLSEVEKIYNTHYATLDYLVSISKKLDWLTYTQEEKLLVENSVLLVGLLYKMCKVELVLQHSNEVNAINYTEVNKTIADSKNVLIDAKLLPST